ncbi:hypothetical protein DXG01_014255 [Tephrocybe rancida]|nr:hypothetical protein DXG01_014255 [Tephrocybe rancida]
MDGVGGKPGWAWLFFLEGIVSVLFGVLSFFVLPRSVDEASFLTSSEKEEILAQLRREGTLNNEADVFSWREVGSKNAHVQYASLFFSIAGINSQGPALATWLSNNAAPQTRRATAIALGFVMTNVGAIIALWLFSAWSKPPRYTTGTIVLLVFSCMMVFLCFCNLFYLQAQNQKKAFKRKKGLREEEAPGLGDGSAWFAYTL